jgi:magnesium transporter
MSVDLAEVTKALTRRYLLDYPGSAAQRLETLSAEDAADALAGHPPSSIVPVFSKLAPDLAAAIIERLSAAMRSGLLEELMPNDAARLLGQFDEQARAGMLADLQPGISAEIRRIMDYPPESAGWLMDTRICCFRGDLSVEEAISRLRHSRAPATRSLFLVDEGNRLVGQVGIREIAVAPAGTYLRELAEGVDARVSQVTPREEVVEILDRYELADLPVVDAEGRLLGVIYHASLIDAIQADASVDIQTMVGASADERALSTPMFAVAKRLPWLQINLLTAFLAASVVGLFESTIAAFTALAVLLPVVAGQAGNAGAQALAVTMRGLALREITLRHSFRVTLKEVQVGLINGVAVAATCGLGVYLWSGSWGLVLVIVLAMVLAMIAAGFAGALVPLILTRLGQDPAQSSSIILTTVTDVTGFMAFLGIATMLSTML